MTKAAVVAALGAALVRCGAAAELPQGPADARARGLGADDACAAEGAGACAVHALQRASGRGGAVEKEVAAQRRGDDEWVWPEDLLDKHMRVQRYDGDDFWEGIQDIFAPRLVQHCLRYNSFFWPQTSFWSQEVLRRVDALPDNMDAETQGKLQDFTRKASWLMCNFWFDPRQGTNWSQPVTEYMNKVRAMPATDLEMPRLEGSFFESNAARDNMWSGDSCMYWASNLMCDVGHMARDMTGSKDLGDELCWDTVESPANGFSVFGVSLQPGRKAVKDSDNDFVHPEYKKCQEKDLTKDVLTKGCPMFGHYPVGYMNVSYWGTALPKGSAGRAEVLQCEKKLGIPYSSPTTYGDVTHRPWNASNGGVDLMSAPPASWKQQSFFDMNETRAAFTHAVRDALLPTLTPNCSPSDWFCIVKSLDQQRRASEAKSGVKTDIPISPEVVKASGGKLSSPSV